MNDEKLKEEVRKACEILKNGGIILYPTDTIWGIGCDATNEAAVKRVYELKHREDSKAMLVLLDDVGKLASYVEVPDVAYELLEVNDKPMTIIYPNAKNLAKNLIAQDRTIGIRITSEIFTKSLLYRFRKPIVSTSANTAVDYVVDLRQEETTNPAPSSIIKLGVGGEIQIIRK